MSIEANGNVKQTATAAFNTAEVRQVLEKKGLKLQSKSLFEVQENGSVKVDIEGDGIFDKIVTGLVSKKGNINTKASRIEISDADVSTATVKQNNETIAKMEADVKKYKEQSEKEFNEAEAKEQAEKSYNAQLAKMKQEQQTVKNYLETRQKNADVAQMTTKEFKEYQKDVEQMKKALEHGKERIAKFEKNKDDYINDKVELAKSTHTANVAFATKELKKTHKRLTKARAQYNDLLEENGYKTAESRKNVKEGNVQASGSKVEDAKSKNAQLEQTVREFVKTKSQLANQLGEKYEVEIKDDGTVLLRADDGDTRPDFTITGLYDPKKGEMSTDAANIRYMANYDSTTRVKAKIAEFKKANNEFIAMTSDFTIDKNDKKYKEKETEVNKLKQELRDMHVSEEEIMANP